MLRMCEEISYTDIVALLLYRHLSTVYITSGSKPTVFVYNHVFRRLGDM